MNDSTQITNFLFRSRPPAPFACVAAPESTHMMEQNVRENEQAILLLLAILSIPVLLLGKPLMIKQRMKKKAREDSYSSESHLIGEGHGDKDGHDDGHGGHDDHDFSEVVIHQVGVIPYHETPSLETSVKKKIEKPGFMVHFFD